MISKNKIKLIHALAQKKQRYSQHLFVAEGHKVVEDLLSRFECTYLAAKKDWLEEKQQLVSHLHHKGTEIQEVNDDELTRASLLKTPQDVLGIFRIPENDEADRTLPERELCLALDGIQDPGNMGTIVRIADWFGITHIWCSQDTADIYNPKTVQATMGAMARVQVHYTDLPAFLQSLSADIPVYGTFLDGTDMYGQDLSSNGIIVMGNEGNGISRPVGNLVSKRLYIPSFPAERDTVESLNVAIATSIICAEFRRRQTASK